MGGIEGCCQWRGLGRASEIGCGGWNFLGQVRLPDGAVNWEAIVSGCASLLCEVRNGSGCGARFMECSPCVCVRMHTWRTCHWDKCNIAKDPPSEDSWAREGSWILNFIHFMDPLTVQIPHSSNELTLLNVDKRHPTWPHVESLLWERRGRKHQTSWSLWPQRPAGCLESGCFCRKGWKESAKPVTGRVSASLWHGSKKLSWLKALFNFTHKKGLVLTADN